MFRLEGGDWVAKEVVEKVKSGRALFIVNTGDMVWWGKQGGLPSDNPYWKLVNENVLKQLPKPTARWRRPGCPAHVSRRREPRSLGRLRRGRIAGRLPLLKEVRRLRQAAHLQVRLPGRALHLPVDGRVRLSGALGLGPPRTVYEEQMKQLRLWLDEAKAEGTQKVFVSFHAPTFCRAGLGPMPESQNPHKPIASYAKDLDIVVLNGHVHTTELYEVDGVKYLVLGGGGAEQTRSFPGERISRSLRLSAGPILERRKPDHGIQLRPRRRSASSRPSSRSTASAQDRPSRSRQSSYSNEASSALPLPAWSPFMVLSFVDLCSEGFRVSEANLAASIFTQN